MFNFKKRAQKEAQAYETMLREQSEGYGLGTDGLSSTDKLLEGVRDNKDLIDTTEVQLDANREKVAEVTTEKQLNDATSKLVVHRNDNNESLPMMPLDVLNAAQEKERYKAFAAAEVVGDDDTKFWDGYIGQTFGDAPSQLPNSADRFKKLTTDVGELSNRNPVKDMVMASLKDADAMLLHIHLRAQLEGRPLDADENALVDHINGDKERMLGGHQPASPDEAAGKIEKLQNLLRETPVNSPDHDRIQHELEQLIEQARPLRTSDDIPGGMSPYEYANSLSGGGKKDPVNPVPPINANPVQPFSR